MALARAAKQLFHPKHPTSYNTLQSHMNWSALCLSLVNVYVAMEHHHAINGNIHYVNGSFQVRKLLVYQRVNPMKITIFVG